MAPYNSIVEVAGEPHSVRDELVGKEAAGQISTPDNAIACVAHITDLHMTDVESPARFEYVNKAYEDPRIRELLPMQRAQEAINAHAVDTMIRTINELSGGPMSGLPIELVALTGDYVDNVQENE